MSGSVIISNLPPNCNTYELNTHFSDIGLIKRCFLIKNERKGFSGSAQITFREALHAEEAIQKFHSTDFRGAKLCIKSTALERHNDKFQADGNKPIKRQAENGNDFFDQLQPEKKIKIDADETDESKFIIKESKFKNIKTDTSQNDEKPSGSFNPKQESRILVRNVPPQTTEENVLEYFGQYGSIEDVRIPESNLHRKKNCCVFIQFSKASEGAKAITGCLSHKFMGNRITASQAIPKDQYVNKSEENAAAEKKVSATDRVRILKQLGRVIVKNIPSSAKEKDVTEFFSSHSTVEKVKFIKEKGCCIIQFPSQEEANKVIKACSSHQLLGQTIIVELAPPKGMSKKTLSKLVHDQETEEGETEESSYDLAKVKKERLDPKEFKHLERSRDVEEGRTLFVCHLGIDTTAFSVQTLLSQFGEVKAVHLVIDRLSEQSKGTAFVQFGSREGADACLEAVEDPCRAAEITVDGRLMEIRRATARSEAGGSTAAVLPVVKGKDKRNLYLAREGFIREGTQAAQEVSPRDLQLRRLREKAKQSLLADLKRFVSTTRLAVNNLPLTLTDSEMKKIFKEHAPEGARITEARIMRYLGQIDETGGAVSRGYGFITYTKHEHALAALRTINNNPTVFTKNSRPIIEFSIENKAALNLKENRLKRSKQMAAKSKKGAVEGTEEATNVDSKGAYTGFAAKRGDLKAGQKLHKHLGAKVRMRDGKGKPSGKKGAKGSAKTKGGPKSTSGRKTKSWSKSSGKKQKGKK